jgi:hypothetical protein
MISSDESFCTSLEDAVEAFLPLEEEVGYSSPFVSWGGVGRFFLWCVLMGGDSSANVWMGGWMGGTTIPMALWHGGFFAK